LLLLTAAGLQAQGVLRGKVFDKETKETLPGATIILVGTYMGTTTEINGTFEIKNIKPGDYSVKISFMGYADAMYNGIRIEAGKPRTLNVSLAMRSQIMDEVVIVGEKNLVNLDDATSEIKITSDDISSMAVRNISEVVAMQAGVNQTPDGLNIRGGRNYETQYIIDGVSVSDPLSGAGSGLQVQGSAASDVSVLTGGAGAEFSGGAAGVISTAIKEGGEKYFIAGSWQRDNLGGELNRGTNWNTDIVDLSMGGPVPFTKKKLQFFAGANAFLSDDYYRVYAKQLHSSLFKENDSLWSPRQNNSWSGTFKLSYQLKPGVKITLTNQQSISVNQNSRTLQIVGFDAVVQPGLQWEFSQQPDNANTYAHRSNLTALNYQHSLGKKWNLKVSFGRLFTNMRADANGRPFRSETVDRIYDPASIVTDPITIFNPEDSVRYVLPGSGLYNNNGIATRWHDHYAQEYSGRIKMNYYPANKHHEVNFGWEHKEKEYQWADVSRPWVGAPIKIDETTSTPSVSVGSSSEIWKTTPNEGGLWVEDRISYKGITATLGMRYNYWSYGQQTDEAVNDPAVPLTDASREEYDAQTTSIFGKRYASRLLPKVNVSFPVTENNVLYFNYGHSMQMPHPRFIYAGLDPEYLDRSPLSVIGNPIIKPEATVSYEIGYKAQITRDLGITLAAYNNDKYDYIVSGYAIVKDQTGKFVERLMYYNQDYARIVGVEAGVTQRIAKYFKLFANVSFQSARGKSNTARESALQIRLQGFVDNTREQPLSWDRPWDGKLGAIFRTDTTFSRRFFLQDWTVFFGSNFKSGFRYTPVVASGSDDFGRVIYEYETDKPNSKIAKPWFWSDIKISRDFYFNRRRTMAMVVSVEIRNLFNNLNAQIVNPVTGDGYRDGDDVPYSWRDPKYPDPQNNGVPPNNPARWRPPRQVLYGIALKF
jgi:outer membrane receptor protein involved in Fe transport